MDGFVLTLAVIGALLLIVLVLVAGRGAGAPQVVAKPLLTPRERQALEALEQALPDCRIFPQVAMGALIQPKKGLPANRRTRERNSYSQKMVDFVAERRTTGEIAFLIEVDDRTHDSARDKRRDAITAAAGYRTVRIPPRAKIEATQLRQQFASSQGLEGQVN